MTITRYEDNMEKQREMLKRLYPLLIEYGQDFNEPDIATVSIALDLTRAGQEFQVGMWPSIKRIYRALADEQLIARSNERAELDWDQNEDDMAEDNAAQARMLVTRRGMKHWEAEHRLAVSIQHASTNQLV